MDNRFLLILKYNVSLLPVYVGINIKGIVRMLIAVEGCCHGELENIYDALQYTEKINNFKVDLLLICGDFQAVRNHGDLDSMAVPQKYKQLYNFNRLTGFI